MRCCSRRAPFLVRCFRGLYFSKTVGSFHGRHDLVVLTLPRMPKLVQLIDQTYSILVCSFDHLHVVRQLAVERASRAQFQNGVCKFLVLRMYLFLVRDGS